MDIKVYVDTDDDIRIIRRIQRDMVERGRSLDSLLLSVPGYGKTQCTINLLNYQLNRYADIIVPEGGENQVAIDLLSTKIHDILVKRGHTNLQ